MESMKQKTLKTQVTHKKAYTEPTLKQFGVVKKVTQDNTQTGKLDHNDAHHRS